MKGFLITHKGTEEIAALEIKELIGKKAKTTESAVVFDIKEHEELFKLCYQSQSSMGIYYLLSEFNYTNIFADFKKNIQKTNFAEWLSKKSTFRVKCRKIQETDMSTPELEKEFGALIIDHIQKKHNYKQKVDLENPDIIIFVYLTKNKCYLGIDFAGFDLSKRAFNIFMHPAAVKGTIAYSLIRLSSFNKNETLLDTFSGSGNIPIEAALFSSDLPVNFYNKEKFLFLKFEKFKSYNFKKFFEKIDGKIQSKKSKIYNIDNSMKHLNYAKKNSKIAGADKKINFSRIDIEWLDTKFDKGKIDKIVTKIPSLNTKDINKIYNEFFYQADFVLNKKGKIVLIGNKALIEKFAPKYKFKIADETNIFSGKEEYDVFVIVKYK
ncbi:hypothetical protein CMO93_05180 [Candidatus Woesearchaeota archaeon]|nr:hypothetical protein [Candidatus Woesearchaeota archaeon]|tara:strand:- start:6913 stop:8052 length:1140 start_codon:yes stop_codon:yes gene_type:complete